jgi:hypothetical protein
MQTSAENVTTLLAKEVETTAVFTVFLLYGMALALAPKDAIKEPSLSASTI